MLYQPIQFEFSGFKPEYETQIFVSSVADRLHALAPSDSFMSVVMTKNRDAIRATCRISSKAGVFAAETVSNCPRAAIQQIEKTIMNQLDGWKKYRFAENSLKYKAEIVSPVTEAIKQLADHAVKEIKSTVGWDAEVQINVELEAKDKKLYSVSMGVHGLTDPVVVKKQGKNIFAVFRKVKKTVLRQIHRLNDRRITIRKKQFFKEQYAS